MPGAPAVRHRRDRLDRVRDRRCLGDGSEEAAGGPAQGRRQGPAGEARLPDRHRCRGRNAHGHDPGCRTARRAEDGTAQAGFRRRSAEGRQRRRALRRRELEHEEDLRRKLVEGRTGDLRRVPGDPGIQQGRRSGRRSDPR